MPEDFFNDIQEVFFILYGPFLYGLVFPVFVGTGLAIAILAAISRFWRPVEKIEIQSPDRD